MQHVSIPVNDAVKVQSDLPSEDLSDRSDELGRRSPIQALCVDLPACGHRGIPNHS